MLVESGWHLMEGREMDLTSGLRVSGEETRGGWVGKKGKERDSVDRQTVFIFLSKGTSACLQCKQQTIFN